MHLAQLAWIDEQANVCFFGPPGPGSHCPPRLSRLQTVQLPAPRPRSEALSAGLG
jgi:hypothetical protein